jgi:uncharacterized protein YjcR
MTEAKAEKARAKAKAMRAKGKTVVEIAAAIDVAPSTVSTWAKKYGLWKLGVYMPKKKQPAKQSAA